MKGVIVEACKDADAGSIGPFYVAHHAQLAGHDIEITRQTRKGDDVELISVHHCDDLLRLATMKKRAQYRIVGGHIMQNNPRPAIPYADAVCIGEAESWIGPALTALESGGLDALGALPGVIVSRDWKRNAPVPRTLFEKPLPDNPPYLNRPGTRSAAWYVEIARGCPFSCAYCELGHSVPFRLYRAEHLKRVLDRADLKQTRKINFYAPDEASHPDYKALYEHLKDKGYLAGFSSMRVDSVLKKKPPIRQNQLIRVGIDGLSERIRFRVGKKITDDMIVDYFKSFIESGHVQFKMFQVFSYPFEEPDDFDAYERLMRRIMAIRLHKNISLRIKWTPFIPQPCTPLGKERVRYDFEMADRINVWHALNRRPRNEPGIFVENDGMMGARAHKRQIELTTGDEDIVSKYAPKGEKLWTI